MQESNKKGTGEIDRRSFLKSLGLSLIGIKLRQDGSSHATKPELKLNEKIESFEGIEIQGDSDFIIKTKKAITLLLERSLTFLQAKPFLGKIQQSQHSGMDNNQKVPTFNVAAGTSDTSTTWYAGSIAHDSYHSLLYSQYEEINGKIPMPNKPDSSEAAEEEKKCLAFQIQVLMEINASPQEISDVQANMENPQYQKIPYEKRNW